MRRWYLSVVVLTLAGCSKQPTLPDQPADDPSARTTTAFNPPSTPQEMADKCDVPMYPGSEAPDSMSRPPHRDTDGNMHYELVLTSKEPVKKVAAFYAAHLRQPVTTVAGSTAVIGKSPKKNDVIVSVEPESGRTVIRIKAIAYGK